MTGHKRGEAILALNPGSSSLKAAVRSPDLVLTIGIDRLGTDAGTIIVTEGEGGASYPPLSEPFTGGLAAAVDRIAAVLAERGLELLAVSHRVVHGGPDHYRPTIITDDLVTDLRAVVPLAPLHLPGELDSIAHARRAWPDVDHIACFDTGFHHDLPEVSRRLPIAAELTDVGVRRYGFHGLSVQSVLLATPDIGQAVVAHLGSGCSVTAIADGRPRHTTMSLTPTGGMMSGTRSGDLDPEIVLYLIEEHGYSIERIRTLLDQSSGIAGVAGGRHDVRDLEEAYDDAAQLAIDMFIRGAAGAIATCATTLDRWETLVFTGGVGEHATSIRDRICERLLVLRGGAPTADADTPGSPDCAARLAATGLRVLVVPADEQIVLDQLARALVTSRA